MISKRYPNKCISQLHHPKRNELVYPQDCEVSFGDTTSYWITYWVSKYLLYQNKLELGRNVQIHFKQLLTREGDGQLTSNLNAMCGEASSQRLASIIIKYINCNLYFSIIVSKMYHYYSSNNSMTQKFRLILIEIEHKFSSLKWIDKSHTMLHSLCATSTFLI